MTFSYSKIFKIAWHFSKIILIHGKPGGEHPPGKGEMKITNVVGLILLLFGLY
jgi:hypothetical protein